MDLWQNCLLNEQIDENLRIIEKETEQCTPPSQWYDQYASLLHFSECPDESHSLHPRPRPESLWREPKSLQNYRFFSSSGNTILEPPRELGTELRENECTAMPPAIESPPAIDHVMCDVGPTLIASHRGRDPTLRVSSSPKAQPCVGLLGFSLQ